MVGLVLPHPDELLGLVLIEWTEQYGRKIKRMHTRGNRDFQTKVAGLAGYYHPEALAVLVSNDPSISTPSVFTGMQLGALHIACKEGQKDVVQMLLHEGKVDVNLPDANGFRAVHYAVK